MEVLVRARQASAVSIVRAAIRTNPGSFSLLTATVAVAAAVPAGLAVASGSLVSEFAGPGRDTTGQALIGVVSALGLLFLLLQTLTPLAVALGEELGRHLDREVSDRVMAALQRPTSIARIEDPRTLELLATIDSRRAEASMLDAVVGVVELTIIRVGAVAGAAVLVGYHWWLAVLLVAGYGGTMVLISRTYQRALTTSERAPDGLRRALYLQGLVVRPVAAKDVRLFGLGDWLTALYRGERERVIRDIRHTRRGAVRADVITGVVALVVQGMTFLLLAVDMNAARLSSGEFTMYAVAATGVLALHLRGPGLLSIARSHETLCAVAELERCTADVDRDVADATARPILFHRAIECQGLGFRYPGSDRWVLRDLNLVIPAGSSTAIVGLNGSGKTTLVKLLAGLYEPTEGRILVDGVDLRELGVRRWQPHCAALFQDWLRWGVSLRDNILIGAPDAPADPERFAKVVAGADLSDVAATLPDGWDTVLGREFGGVDLSGGQWQRVGLARALWALNAQARVLILDEPTSALDARGEAGLYDTLLTAAQGKTIVLISHRFSTVRRADGVVVLSGGAISEQGNHDSLMAQGGAYAEMFSVQSDRFVKDGDAR